MSATRLIVSGTDTGVGKTVLAAAATMLLDGEYWKPIQSGLEGESDTETVARLTALAPERFHAEGYRLTNPLSPDQSAMLDGVTIEEAQLLPPATRRPLVIEGAGGVLVPVSDRLLQVDLFRLWRAPVLLAIRSGLGTLNHTLLTVEALARRDVPVLGLVMIGPEHAMNRATLERWCAAPVLGILPYIDPLDHATLRAAARAGLPSGERLAALIREMGNAAANHDRNDHEN